MTEPLPPEQLEQLMAGYALEDLSAEEAQELERLVANNPQLTREMNRLEEVLQLLSYGLPEVDCPPHLRTSILNAALKTQLNPVQKVRRLPWSKIVASVAALIALALGLDNYRLRQSLQAIQIEKQPLYTRTYSLQATNALDVSSAKVFVNPNNLEAELKIKDLPPLPPGKVYVLWTVLKQDAPFTTDDKGAILTEVFTVDAQGNVSQTFTLPNVFRSQGIVSKIAVTVENEESPQKHTGSPILITPL